MTTPNLMFLCTYTNCIMPQGAFFLPVSLGANRSFISSWRRQLTIKKDFRYSKPVLTRVTNAIFVDNLRNT